jgi:hypothetical protein
VLQRPPSSKSLSRRARKREQRRQAQARWRAHARSCTAIYSLALDDRDLNWLVSLHYLREADAGNGGGRRGGAAVAQGCAAPLIVDVSSDGFGRRAILKL